MTIGDSIDGSGSSLLNAISRDLLGRTEGNRRRGPSRDPIKIGNKSQVFSVYAIK